MALGYVFMRAVFVSYKSQRWSLTELNCLAPEGKGLRVKKQGCIQNSVFLETLIAHDAHVQVQCIRSKGQNDATGKVSGNL